MIINNYIHNDNAARDRLKLYFNYINLL